MGVFQFNILNEEKKKVYLFVTAFQKNIKVERGK